MRLQEVFFWLWALWVFAGGIPALAGSPEIVGVEPGLSGDRNSDHLIFYSDGSVGFLKNHPSSDFKRILSRLKSQQTLREAPVPRPYEPSILSQDEANVVFNSMNPRVRRRSQCFNRALIWGYEAWKNLDVRSMKVFMFFTSKYIREYRYKWWFHASPLVLVRNTGGGTEEQVLDRYFMKKPVDLKTWSDYFVAAKTPCPVAEKYSDYKDHQNEAYCYFMKIPMYYWQPRDLEARDQGNPHPPEFIGSEVQAAYDQAFP